MPARLTGNPGPITVANGWTLITGPTNVTAAAAGVTNVLSGMNFQIPANTTYRFAIVTSNTQISYGGTSSVPNIFSAVGVNLLVGNYNTNIGWASPWDWATWAFQPRFFNGAIHIEANPCTNPPTPGNTIVSAPIICANDDLDLDLQNHSTGGGQTYEWEFSTNNITFSSISPANTIEQYTYQPTQSGYYRCKVTCGTGTPVYSSVVYVKINSPIIYDVSDTTVCGGGLIPLSAIVDTGVLVKWYDNINSNTPIFTGNPFITPNINVTTTYYVEASNMDHSCPSAKIPVTVTVIPAPTKPFGSDYSICVDPNEVEFLDAFNPGCTYLWDNNYQGRVRTVTQTGTYHVAITNNLGCTTYDTIKITFNENPLSELGNDTSVCNGTNLYLDAGNAGIQYYWNNGANTNAINTKFPGQYYVNIIAANGCITIDTINIDHNGEAPALTGIHIQNVASHTFKFNALNPQNVIGYEWIFGDGSANSYLNTPTHQYNALGNYLVQLNVSSTCGMTFDTMSVHIYSGTGVENINGEKLIVIHPNPATDNVNITASEDIIIEHISIYDIQGRNLNNITSKISAANKAQVNIEKLAAGQYTLEIKTNKGVLKDQLIKVVH
jgi:PKD repeat protein